MSERTVDCCTHGKVRAAFVCTHTLKSLEDAEARGFIWTRDESGCLNAYCSLCDEKLQAVGGDWNDEAEAFAGVTMVCEGCASKVAGLNGVKELPQ
ncbi:hypothetical protein [Maricaulis sp.]|uniref:hypothetical protein n=1 Tax=Maricaulis sp. TaxID=1486257 RepID=UPI003A8E0546